MYLIRITSDFEQDIAEACATFLPLLAFLWIIYQEFIQPK